MNIIFAAMGYRVFTISPPNEKNPISGKTSVVLISPRVSLHPGCKKTEVAFMEVKGRICIAKEHVLGFLQVVDRRRYEVELVKRAPERFTASPRLRAYECHGLP